MKREIKKYNKLLDEFYEALRPNLYKFLIERNVDDKIAEEAQEFICEKLDSDLVNREVLMEKIEDIETKISEILVAKVNKILEEAADAIDP